MVTRQYNDIRSRLIHRLRCLCFLAYPAASPTGQLATADCLWTQHITFLLYVSSVAPSRSFCSTLCTVLQLPLGFAYDHLFLSKEQQPPFVQYATGFQDVVIRCVRFAFARFPSRVGRVFFSKEVALPFARWRMLRHGIYRSPLTWYEVVKVS